MIDMTPVQSGHIEAIGYDDSQDMMVVHFRGGAEYAYSNVSFDQYESIKEAGSVGSALARSGLKGQRI